MFTNLALVGMPLKHSYSPYIHTAFLRASAINGGYCCFETEGGLMLRDTVRVLRDYSFRGFNITVPHKQEIMDLLDDIDPAAAEIGAVNTVLINQTLKGYNTDVFGFERMIKSAGCKMDNAEVLLLGCGGASKAVLYVLKKHNVKLTVINRDLKKAENILKTMNFDSATLEDYNFIKSDRSFNYVINGTSMGLEDGVFADMSHIECDMAAIDLQYKKGHTPFISNMQHCGCAYLDGFPMLVYQAAGSFEIWTGVYPDFSVAQIGAALGL